MTETRTYELPAGEHAGAIGGEERIYAVPGEPGTETTVEVTDGNDMAFIEGVLGRKPTDVEVDEPEPAEVTQPEPGDTDPLARLSSTELREQLRARELSTSGSKAEMTARLKAATGADSAEEVE